jgi:formate hydrogenlyase subunit 4
MSDVLSSTLHIAVALVAAPLQVGVINKTKAWFAGRVGPPVLQPYYDLMKLAQKDSVFSTTTTWVFRAGPVVSLVTAVFALLLIPLGSATAPVSFTGDLVLFAYLFALGRFFTVSAALDTGSSFEGMGAAREVTFACFAEPALFLGMLVLAKLSGSIRLVDMLGTAGASRWGVASAPVILVLLSWFVVLLAENCRIPFDDPNTHLELTMIHEVMVLDHSGPAFAMILYGVALKLFVFAALVVRLVLPLSDSPGLDWAAFLAGIVFVSVIVGVVESVMARLRLVHIPTLLVGACLLSAFGVILAMR